MGLPFRPRSPPEPRCRERGATESPSPTTTAWSGAEAMYEKYPDRIIPGEEVKTGEGIDLIGLYLTKEIKKGTGAREACDLIREDGGIVYLPHPYASGKGGGGKYAETLAPYVDVVEVFNARMHPGRLNRPAQALAEANGKLMGAGSDAHTLREVGGAWVEVPVHNNHPAELLEALVHAQVGEEPLPSGFTWPQHGRKSERTFRGRSMFSLTMRNPSL